MSEANIKRDIRAILTQSADDYGLRRDASSRYFYHRIRFTTTTIANGYIKGINSLATSAKLVYNKMAPFNTVIHWSNAILTVLDKMAKFGVTGGSGVGIGAYSIPRTLKAGRLKILNLGTQGVIEMEADEEVGQTQIDDLLTYFRKRVYRQWITDNDLLKTDTAIDKHVKIPETGQRKGKSIGVRKFLEEQIGRSTAFAHDERSTIAVVGVIKAIEDEFNDANRYPDMTYEHVKYNLIDDIFDLLEIDFREELFYNPKTKMIEARRVVTGEIKEQKKGSAKERTDKAQLRKEPGIKKILKKVMERIKKESKTMSKEEAAKLKGSPSFRQQAAQAAQYAILRQLMQKNKKHIVTKKIKTTEPKLKPKNISIKKAKSPKRKVIIQTSRGKSRRILKGSEKGQGKQANTNQAADLARLRKYIQGRLPAEVRRNMGRPALRNRTGRFSNSVQLLSLQQAQNTIMAKYTYLLSPYQTFENTGRRRWPMAYNPKPIIAKSIRNLALGRIEQKLTVRRV